MTTRSNKAALFNKGIQQKVHGKDGDTEELAHIFYQLFLAIATGQDEEAPFHRTPVSNATRAIGNVDNAMLQKWSMLMNKWVSDPKNVLDMNRKDRSSARGNLQKEFKRPRWSWKVFMKGMSFLEGVKLELNPVLTLKDGRRYSVSSEIVLDPENTPESQEILAKHQVIITPDDEIPKPE